MKKNPRVERPSEKLQGPLSRTYPTGARATSSHSPQFSVDPQSEIAQNKAGITHQCGHGIDTDPSNRNPAVLSTVVGAEWQNELNTMKRKLD